MAEQHHPHGHGSESGGTMDISENVKTWNAFWNGTKWSVVGLIVLAVLLFIFRTHNG